MENERIQISPLARAYLAAVRAGNLTRGDAERQVINSAEYILRYGISGCTPDVLRVAAAICQAVAELKEEAQSDALEDAAALCEVAAELKEKSIEQDLSRRNIGRERLDGLIAVDDQ